MSLFDSFRGHGATPPEPARSRPEDELALERYRYMLRTAPPDQIERAHAEAFARLTPEQRQRLLRELAAEVPPEERVPDDDPRALARMATRAEMRQPGAIERTLGAVPGGSFGGLLGGTLLGSLVGSFLGTAAAEHFFGDHQLADHQVDVGPDQGWAGDSRADQGEGPIYQDEGLIYQDEGLVYQDDDLADQGLDAGDDLSGDFDAGDMI